MTDFPVTFADVEAAAERISRHARRTPVVQSTTLNAALDAQVFCKAEMLQRTGSFKFRGAMSALTSIPTDERKRGVVTYSSGNHGQAVSRAAGILGVPATVVMPTDAPEIKRAATAAWGATIVDYDRYAEDRAEVAARVVTKTDALLIPPYDLPAVIAGQGTMALELIDEVGDLDLIVVCLGGGGLLAGTSIVATHLLHDVKLIGVEPEASNDHVLSREAGHIVELDSVPQTIADGQQVTAPGLLTWQINHELVDRFVTVTDDQLIDTMRFIFGRLKLVAEPSGASALAAVRHLRLIEPGMRVGVTLSGGNVDPTRYAAWL